MNRGNEKLLAWINAMRKMPRWALVLATVGLVVVLGIAMFLLIPQKTDTTGNSSYLASTGLAFGVFLKLGVVVVLIVGLAIILRRWQSTMRAGTQKRIEVVETVHLSQHRSLYLVNVGGKSLLLGGTDQSISTLTDLSSDDVFSAFLDRANVDQNNENK
jgi:flagellar biosynthetic protein FliO